jgi:hypothetical protein
VRKAVVMGEKKQHCLRRRAVTKFLFSKKITIFKDALKGFHHFAMKFSILEELFTTIG